MTEPSPPVFTAPVVARRPSMVIVLGLLLAAACFALGWCAAERTRSAASAPPPRGAGTAASEPARPVPILVDAGALVLLPDAALHLEPIEPPRMDAGEKKGRQGGRK